MQQLLQQIGEIKGRIVFKKEHFQFIRSHAFIIVSAFSFLALALVFFRMKQVEFDYQYDELSRKIEKEFQKEKSLRAEKAKLLSVKNLSVLAKKYDFERPKENQVIVVPQDLSVISNNQEKQQ